ncbi:nuclear pore complex protein Nup154 isoform X2 [Lycorma delicatula]
MLNSSVGERVPPVDPFRVQMEALELAGKTVEKHITQDNSFPLLIDRMRITAQSGPTFSGLSEVDYPSSTGVVGLNNINNLCTINKVPLPPEIMEHFSHMQCHCMMGLFSEISRAWLTIDSDIYIWDFEHGSDLAYYDGLSETIISVGLVKPKPGVFLSYIRHLLVITTTVDIVVLGVTFKKTSDRFYGHTDELHLTPDVIYSLSTDCISITTIAGTDNGRIFLGGKDGSLFEIMYQKELGWWGKRCKKVNHSTGALSFLVPSFINAAFTEEDAIAQISVDNSRHILYTLSEKGMIELFDLGESGQSTARIACLSQAGIVQSAVQIVRTFDSADFRPIVSISAIELRESPHLGLVAVTETGARLYFTTGQPGYRPSTLQLIHVRLPPGFIANAPATRPNKVHKAIYSAGNLLLVTSPGANQDKVWCLSGDAFPLQPMLSEAQTVISLDGIVWAVGEIKMGDPPPTSNAPQPPLIVRQIYEPAKKFVLLTPHGAEIMKKLRPVDMLVEILVEANGPDSEAVKSYFCTQTEQQAAATCLIIACNQSSQNTQLSEWATRAFFLYGGEPKVGTVQSHHSSPCVFIPYSSLPAGFNPGTVSTPIGKSTFSSTETNTVYFSAKHNGLYLYLSRILRPLWDTRIVQRVTMNDNKQYLVSSVMGEEVAIVAGHLLAVKSFLEKNTQFSSASASLSASSSGVDSLVGAGQRSRLQEAQLAEKQSLDALRTLVDHAAQVLGLWRVVCNHQFHCIADALSQDQQNQMVVATFRDLILVGQDLCASLINKLINTYLSDNTSVDSISLKLREICPKLYKNEDAACTKANEMLLTAKTRKNKEERQNLLWSALKLCKEVSPNINLSAVCRQFAACQFYEGVLELSLECANKSDPKNVAFHFYQNNQPPDDTIGYQAYAQRMDCYKEITLVLDQLHHQSQVNPQSPSIPVSPGAPQPPDLSTPTSCDALHHAKRLKDMALATNDELLHVAVYDWMVSQRLFGDLIAAGRPSLEVYLNKAATAHPESTQLSDLLWKYHEINGNHAAAAQILYNLAKQPGETLTLSERITYLAKAVICMRSDEVGCAPHLGVFLHELEDLVQVARVQKQVLDAVTNLVGRHHKASEAVTRLNSCLLTITELYEEFAEPFDLWDCKLAIVECSGHDDPDLINNIWENIIQTELAKCDNTSGDNKISVVMSKVKMLGQQYSLSSRVFPLWFLVWQLELACCQLGALRSHVHSTLISMGVPLIMLLDVYEKLFALNDRCWINEGCELYLVEVIASLAESFTLNPKMVHTGERKKVAIRMQDLLTNCLSTLYSKPDTNDLINKLKTVKTNLNRIH